MNQFLSVWDALEPRKRIIVVLSVLAMFAAVLGLSRMVNQPHLSLLYAGLEPSTSGEIVTAIEGQKVAYEVRGDAIYVDSSRRDEIRMTLAGQGLPANGNAGYELLDGLSGFGTTSQMFNAAYWRAKEGELARTILASPQVKGARVHISNSLRQTFGRSEQMTASVIATMGAGTLSVKQAKAMRYLVASAVSGMDPDQVSVIDSSGGIILAAGSDAGMGGDEDMSARSANMRNNIERLLAARVGAGNAIVEVNIDADMNSETITERVLDPEGRVAISSDTEEKSSSASGSGANGVTVASNLPDGDTGGGANSQSNDNQVRERVNYEVSEVRRERIKYPGEIRRISVAVLVNGVTTQNDAGETVWEERGEEELTSLKELVQSAIGFDAARGDVVTISSLEFTAPQEIGTYAEAGALDFFAVNAMSLIQMIFLGLVALALGMGVLKPILTAPPTREIAALDESNGGTLDGTDGSEGEIELNPEVLAMPTGEQQTIDKLKETVTNRSDDSAALLEDWLNGSELESEGA